MKKMTWLLITGLLIAGGCKSSDIPERREFPVNSSVNPCTDFYEYTCSKVVDSFKLREDRSRHVFSFSDSYERILEKKKQYLGELKAKEKLSKRSTSLKNVYMACMDEKASAAEEKKWVAQIIKEVGELKTRLEFQKYIASHIDQSRLSFIGFGSDANQDDPNWDDVYFDADLMGLPERSYYQKKEVVADYQKLLELQFKTVGLDRPGERAAQMVDWESTYSLVYPLPREFRELFNSRTGITKAQLLAQYPAFRLAAFLEKIPNHTHIRHLEPEAFAKLNKTLMEGDLSLLKTIYLSRELDGFMDDAYPQYFKQKFEFKKKHLGGAKERPQRKERCTRMVMGKFTKELDAEMLPLVFPNFPEERFTKLVEKVRQSIIEGVKANQWLSPAAKKAAELKMKTARLKLVKPKTDEEWDFNPEADYTSDRHYENMRILGTNLIRKKLAELSKKRNRNKWHMGPLTVNAYYNPPDNEFVLPIGILQYPFYDPALPDEVNLGAVGMVVGHELGHGVDDMGSRYDHKGRLKQWMTKQDVAEFRKRGSRLEDQFSKIGHDGKLTLGENIGDLVGMGFAFNAAFPGGEGDIDAKKSFYTQYGRLWCNVTRPKREALQLKTDPHALGKARVNEQVKHQPGFAAAFGCKKGDPMNLPDEERVRVW